MTLVGMTFLVILKGLGNARWTHYLFLVESSTAVGGGEGGGAGLAVPWHVAVLCAAAD